jgi:hypothetical protein
MLCAATVGFGLHLLGFVPFTVLANVVLTNNLVTSTVLAPLLLRALYPRVRRARLLYADVLGGEHRPTSRFRRATGIGLAVTGTVAAFVLGNVTARGWAPEMLAQLPPNGRFALATLPGLLMAAGGLALL